jgi:hypothetical protein
MFQMKVKRIVTLVFLLAIAGFVVFGRADNNPPSQEEKEFARETADLLHNEVFAALLQEFGETTPQNVEQGKRAISLIFNNANRDIRLIGVFPPLLGGSNNIPSDSFERKALTRALQGLPTTSIERVGDGWYYRRSVALSNTMHASCALCHTNFTTQFFEQTNNDGQWVGALTLRVPIREN